MNELINLDEYRWINLWEGESVAEYVVALKELSIHCDFGNVLDDALRDLLVCGLYKETTQKDYLQKLR